MNPFLQPQESDSSPQLATVAAVDGNGRVSLIVPTTGEAGMKHYPRLASYTPTVGDRVYIVRISGTYLVVGKVV